MTRKFKEFGNPFKNKLYQDLRKRNSLYSLKRFLDDYVQSVRPLIQSSDQLRAKYGSKRYPVIGKKNDLNLLVDKTSANPLVVFKLLRRFAKQLADIAVKVLNDDTESGCLLFPYI